METCPVELSRQYPHLKRFLALGLSLEEAERLYQTAVSIDALHGKAPVNMYLTNLTTSDTLEERVTASCCGNEERVTASCCGNEECLPDFIFAPGRLLSLFDLVVRMESFNLRTIVHLYHIVKDFGPNDPKSPISTFEVRDVETVLPHLKEFAKECIKFGFDVTHAYAIRAVVTAESIVLSAKIPDWQSENEEGDSFVNTLKPNLQTFFNDMNKAFVIEAEALKVLYIERNRVMYWNDLNTNLYGVPLACHIDDWNDILNKLPQEATEDLVEAGKCYACGRQTACVMHLCRLFECAFKTFVEKHNVPSEYGKGSSWEKLRDDLDKHIHNKTNPLTDDEKALFSRVRTQISILAAYWRNPSMHSGGTFYSDEQALEIYHGVRNLVRELVTSWGN